jgi:hypothetical protein
LDVTSDKKTPRGHEKRVKNHILIKFFFLFVFKICFFNIYLPIAFCILLKFDKKPRIQILIQANSPHCKAYFLNKNSFDKSKFINQKGKLLIVKYFKNLNNNLIKIIVLNKFIIHILFLIL